MRCFIRTISLILLPFIFLGCSMLPLAGMPISAPQIGLTATASPTLFMAPTDATATPTPFQPIPPTEIYLPTNTPTPSPTLPPPTDTPAPTPFRRSAGTGGMLSQPPNQVNILLLGADQRYWSRSNFFRTDTIMLATLNSDLGTVNLTSFPRDLWVTLPNWGTNRINTAYEFGGIRLLSKTFEYNFGIRPDYYVLINFTSFKRVIDGLGGLEVKVSQPLADYYNGRWLSIPAGTVHMDADKVLWYTRSRKTSNDFVRSRRQHEVLMAVLDKMLSLGALQKAPEFYNIYKENVTTDIAFSDFLSLLPYGLKITDGSHVKHFYIGPAQVYDWITPQGAMVLLPNDDAIQKVLRKALNIP